MSARDGGDARRVAIEAVRRIDDEGAYANLVLSGLLDASHLDTRDRGLVTELTYGATRMRRACDWLVDRFLVSPPPPALRAALRVGAYQLAFTRIPPHAAVSATVSGTAKRNRGVVNAILRRVADSLPVTWPDDATRLSVPDWLLARLRADLGDVDAMAMLETMNLAPEVTERADGYVQDEASQWVAELVGASAGELVLDLCAAPGGKATAMAAAGATVVAGDRRVGRVGLITQNAQRLGATSLVALAADGLAPPFADATFDRVLVDAPCSGLGVLRRRADARWRVTGDDIDQLAALQRALLDRAVALVRPGGTLVYSVCTVTDAETVGVAGSFAHDHADLEALPVPDPWRPHGSGGLVLPQDHGTDGMAVFVWRRP
ncbi:MAG: transcription antitermination factor NusB [Acidimicrobiales bacterium]